MQANWYHQSIQQEAGAKDILATLMLFLSTMTMEQAVAATAQKLKVSPDAVRQVQQTQPKTDTTVNEFQGSAHFSKTEFACKCCGQAMMDPAFIQALEKFRTICGNRSIRISSGYRCQKHNKGVGGAEKSQHIEGQAADINIQGLTTKQVYDLANKSGLFGGIGYYQGWVHVDNGPAGRRWSK